MQLIYIMTPRQLLLTRTEQSGCTLSRGSLVLNGRPTSSTQTIDDCCRSRACTFTTKHTRPSPSTLELEDAEARHSTTQAVHSMHQWNQANCCTRVQI